MLFNVPFWGVLAIDSTHWIALWNVANDNADKKATKGASIAASVIFEATSKSNKF